MADRNLAAPCGLCCESCEQLGKSCSGCWNEQGKPYWTTLAKVEICPLYDCCINKKQLEHCGLCNELPCKTFNEFYDPALSPEEAEKSINARIETLKKR